MQEFREMQRDKNNRGQYYAAPLEDDPFEWHFSITGPPDTAFSGGRYHGRIILPKDYPFKPPNIVLLTPNGRFAVGEKICLSISSHHSETWQPAWGIRIALLALRTFMPADPDGAVGSLDWSDEHRRRLAISSWQYKCDRCGADMAALFTKGSATQSGGSSAAADPNVCVEVPATESPQ